MLTNLRTWFCRSVMTLLLMLPVTLGWANGYIHWGLSGNSNWSDAELTYNGKVGTVDITLEAGKTYEFLFKDTGANNNEEHWYKFSGNPQEVTDGTSYTLSTSNSGNGKISNAKGGTYTFTVTWSNDGTPTVSITYPTSVPANLPSSLTFRSDYTGWDNTDRSMTMEDNGKKWSYTIDFTSGSIPNAVWFRLIDTNDANHSIISKNNGDEVPVDGDAIEGQMTGSDNQHNFKFIPSGYSKYTITAEYKESKWMVSVKSVSGSEMPEPTVDTYYLIIPNANVGNTRRAVPASEGIAPAGHTAFKFTQTRKRNSTTLMKDLTTINLKIDGDKGQQLRYDSNGEIRFYIKAGTTAYRPTSGDDELTFATNTSTNGVDAYVSRTQFASNNNHYYKIKRSTVGESTKSVTFMFSKNNESNGNTIGGSNGNANSRPSVSGNLIVGFMQTRGYGSAYYNNHIKDGGVYLVGAMGGSYTSDTSYPMTKIVYPAGTDESAADSIVYVCEVKKGDNTWDNFFLSFSTGDIVGKTSGSEGIYWNLLLRPNVQNQMDGQALEGGVFFFANDQATDNQQQALNPLLSEAQKQRYVSYKVYFNATYSTYRIEFYDNFYIAGPAVHGVANTAVNSGDYFKPEKRLAMRTEEVHGVTHYVYTGKFTNGSTFAFFVNPETYANNYSEDDKWENVTNNTGDMWTTQAPTGGGDYPFYNHVRWNTDGDNTIGSLGQSNNGIKWTLPTGTYTLRFYNHAERSDNNQLYTIDKVVTLKNATSVFAETEGGVAVEHNYGGWRTFSDDCALWLPNGIKAYYASGITTGGKVQLTEVEDGMIPAHTGVLIYDGNLLAGSEEIHLYPVPTDYTTQLGSGTTNLFVDCYDQDYTISYHPENGKYNYFFTCFYKKLGDFSKSNVPMNFWKTRDQNAKAKKNYTYLQVPDNINPRAFNSEKKNYEPEPDATNVANNARDYCFLFSLDDLDDPLITGITAPAVENSMETKAEGWYTMQGVKIQKPVKAGMYILNGRKVIVR